MHRQEVRILPHILGVVSVSSVLRNNPEVIILSDTLCAARWRKLLFVELDVY